MGHPGARDACHLQAACAFVAQAVTTLSRCWGPGALDDAFGDELEVFVAELGARGTDAAVAHERLGGWAELLDDVLTGMLVAAAPSARQATVATAKACVELACSIMGLWVAPEGEPGEELLTEVLAEALVAELAELAELVAATEGIPAETLQLCQLVADGLAPAEARLVTAAVWA